MMDEASRVLVSLDRRRLQAGRELRGLSQAQLAREAAVTPAAISQFENGHARPSANTFVRVASALDLPVSYFERRPERPVEEPVAFFRSLRSTSAVDRRRASALTSLVHDLVVALEQHVTLPPLRLLDARGARDDGSIDEAAAAARAHMGLSALDPVPDVTNSLERNGVVAARFHIDAATVDAFGVAFQDRPIVVLGSDKGIRDRSRFDAAHELAHLVLRHGPDDAGTRGAESQAHRFAAAFLMPEEAIIDDLPRRADWEQLMRLKRRWQVSLAALLKRAQTLGVMGDNEYTLAMKTMSARRWRNPEPGDLGAPEKPTLLARAVEVAEQHGVPLEDLAAENGLPIRDLKTILQPSVDPRPRVVV
jgi:Zn-dependent peptidase ImmA (M78 family)/transcriptional regulator with XRE-family HTH domain